MTRKDAMTSYTVLSQDKGGLWREFAEVQAPDAGTAVREALKGVTDPAGTYVALARFRPVTVELETTTRLKVT